MEVIRASALGMCFGVRDALAAAQAVRDPTRVTVYGQLVHNEEVLRELSERGFSQTSEGERDGDAPDTEQVLVTAHGIGRRERDRLEAAGKRLIDTTCPLVREVHAAARRLERDGFFIIVIGRPDHVEVKGITGHVNLNRYDVVGDPASVRSYGEPRLGVVCQSTTAPDHARLVLQAIRDRNQASLVRYVDTICRPTRQRQAAVESLLGRVDAVVVVGGRNSNNTMQLVRRARARNVPVLHVQTARDLDPTWLVSFRVVGLTAGTSTLDRTVDDVHRALLRMDAARGTARPTSVVGALSGISDHHVTGGRA